MRVCHRVLALLLFTATSSLAAQVTWFSDGFARKEPGPAWSASRDIWRIENGVLTATTGSYDQMLACSLYVHGSRPFVIEAVLRGSRAGVFFSIDDTATKALSQMIRFDDATLLAGYFNGAGEFVATRVLDAPHPPAEWTSLRIHVDPDARAYRIFVDGTDLGTDTLLRFRSGYAGVQASEGRSEFRSFTISGEGPPSGLPDPVPGGEVRFDRVRSVFADDEGIVILDPVRNALLTLTEEGTLIRSRPVPQEGGPKPAAPARAGNVSALIQDRVLVLTDSTTGAITQVRGRLVAPSIVIAGADSSFFVADPGAGAVFRFSRRGELTGEERADLAGGFHAPRGLALLGSDRILVADHDRLVILPADLRPNRPLVESRGSTAVNITWQGTDARNVPYAADGGAWKQVRSEPAGQGFRRVLLADLAPLSRFSFRIPGPLSTIPPSRDYSRDLRFTTPAAAADMLVLTRLPVLLMVYRTITYRDAYSRDLYPQIPDGRSMTQEEIAMLRNAAAFNSGFFFRNSRCAVVLDFDVFVVEDTLYLREVGEKDPYWLGPTARVTADFERAAESLGRRPEEYNGLVVPYAWVNHPPRRTSALRDPSKEDTLTIRQMYGGGTYGVPAPWKYGTTSGYTGNPFQDRFSRQDWLITHEFHHQIDALMEAAGFTSYYHADQPWKMPGSFGEDFDFNAAIIREAGRESWLGLKAGRLAAVRDADRDGVPDDDPSLPFDELRMGSLSDRSDTDGDGLLDLAEAMAGIERGADPQRTDTDGDGIADGMDPHPLSPVSTVLRTLTSSGTPDIARVTREAFARLDSMTTLYLCADDSALYAGFCTHTHGPDPPTHLGFLFQIDGDGDGWFHGFDNTQIRLRWSGDSIRVMDYYLRDCSSWSDPPKDRKDILRSEDLRILHDRSLRTDGTVRHTLVARIPFHATYGPSRGTARPMRVRFGFQTTEDRWVWQEAFERNVMVPVMVPQEP